MSETKKGFWLLKYPAALAFLLPAAGLFGVALATQGLLAGLLAVFGEGLRSFRELPGIVNDGFRIFLAFFLAAIINRTCGEQFHLGLGRKHIRRSFLLASPALLVAVDNLVEYSMAGLALRSSVSGVLIALLNGAAPGIFEEIFCRGLVLTNMMYWWRHKKNGIFCSALVSGTAFGLVHLLNLLNGDVKATLLQVLYAAGLGIFFGAVYLRTHNLWGTIIVHGIIDFCAFLFLGDPETAGLTVILGIAIAIVYAALGFYLVRPEKWEEINSVWEGK